MSLHHHSKQATEQEYLDAKKKKKRKTGSTYLDFTLAQGATALQLQEVSQTALACLFLSHTSPFTLGCF